MKKKFDRKFFFIALIEIAVVVLLIIVVAAFANRYFANNKSKPKPVNKKDIVREKGKRKPSVKKNTVKKQPSKQKSKAEPDKKNTTGEQEWLNYENKRYSFEIGYPSNYVLKELTNNNGVTLTNGKSKIFVYAVHDSSKNINNFINKKFKNATNKEIFSTIETEGKTFLNNGDKYVVFKNKNGSFVIIMAKNPDEVTTGLVEDVAFTYAGK